MHYSPTPEVLLLVITALIAFGAAAAIALSLGRRRARLAQRVLTIIAVAQLVLTGAVAWVLAY
jgi:hypothetical protein